MSGKVAIVGMMASGKTTIGQELARVIGAPFIDSDHEMIANAGMTVAEYFARHGETAFRKMERETIASLLARPGSLVLSLGGGAFMQPEIREILRAGARTVFLKVTADEIVGRLEGTRIANRPLLAAAPDWRARVGEILAERESIYAGSDIVFDACRHDVAGLARELSAILAADGTIAGNAAGGSHD